MLKISSWIAALMLLARIVAAQASCIPYVVEPCPGDPTQYECVLVSSQLTQQTGGESASLLQEYCFRVDSPLLGEVFILVDKGTVNLSDLEEGDVIGQILFEVNLSDFGADCPVGDRARLVAPIKVSIEGDTEVDLIVEIEEVSDPLRECLLNYDPLDIDHNDGILMEGFMTARQAGGFELSLGLAELRPMAIHPGLEWGDLRSSGSPVPLFFQPITRDGLFILPLAGGELAIETVITAENEFFEQVTAVFEESFQIEAGVLEPGFVRGDANSDGTINLTDGIVILNHLFLGSPAPLCMDAADVDDDGGVLPTLTDAIRIFSWLFIGGPPPAVPSPSASDYLPGDCGPDPTPDDGMDCATPSPKCAP